MILVGSTIIALLNDGQISAGTLQTVVTNTTRVVVVLIPGFPMESIILGILVGGISLALIRRRRPRRANLQAERYRHDF